MVAFVTLSWFFAGGVTIWFALRTAWFIIEACFDRKIDVAWRALQNAAIVVVAMFATHLALVELREWQASLSQDPMYQAQIVEKTRALDRYFSKEPLGDNDIWWYNFKNCSSTFASNELWRYNVVIYKNLGGTPAKNVAEFENYYINKIHPALFEHKVTIYSPMTATAKAN